MTPTTPGAKALESRLYAPCCYNGTLDTHDSDLARSLRSEIESRLAGGESSETIQADIVDRYGERVLAARSDAAIRDMAGTLTLVFVVAGLALLYVVRQWARRSATSLAAVRQTGPRAPRNELDERIDAELRDLD